MTPQEAIHKASAALLEAEQALLAIEDKNRFTKAVGEFFGTMSRNVYTQAELAGVEFESDYLEDEETMR